MKSRRSLVFGIVIALCGFVGLAVLDCSGSLTKRFRENWSNGGSRVFKVNRDREKAVERRQLREDLEKEFLEATSLHPELKVIYKDVADEDNGFLQWLDFMDRFEEGLPLPDEIAEMIAGNADWDSLIFKKWVEENGGLVDEILALGLLPDQSVKGVDFDRYLFIGAKTPKQASDLLLARATLAMEDGDFRLVRAPTFEIFR